MRSHVRGIFFRHIPAGGDPLFRPEYPADGRWQRGTAIEGFYLADSEETAWSEWYRALAEVGLPPIRQMPRDLWRFFVDLENVADLSTEEKLKEAGLPDPVPDRSQWRAFQETGEALAEAGFSGILYRSAARLGSGSSLCVFRRGSNIIGVEPVEAAIRHDEPPAPPRGLRT